MSLTKGRRIAGTNKQVKRGAVGKSEMKNGEEVIQYHNGRLKVVRKEFGKLFELEFVQQKGPAEQKELKTFAQHSDVKTPQKDAIKIIKEGVRVAKGKNTYFSMPDSGDSAVETGETEQSTTSGQFIIKS
tara:strand:- start:2140 stop:2529 length:390 start_codon:yes stop_codon:yes gene_type:complete